MRLSRAEKISGAELTATDKSDFVFSFARLGGDISVSSAYKKEFSIRTAVICPTGLGVGFLWSCEGLILSIEDGRFILRRNGNG